jgi:hypothetical protein
MPTKDPHIAIIDAQEKLHQIKLKVRATMALLQTRAAQGKLTRDDLATIKAIRQEAIDATRRVQDELAEELESHERQGHTSH